MKNTPAKLMRLVIISYITGALILFGSLARLFIEIDSNSLTAWRYGAAEGLVLGLLVIISAFLLTKRSQVGRYILPLIFAYLAISSHFHNGTEGIIITISLVLLGMSLWSYLNRNALVKKYYAGNYSS
jgi:hypothetical protein